MNKLLLVSLLLVFCITCEKDFTSISPEWKIRVTVASEPGLREIYLKVELRQVSLPQFYSLTRNDSLILQDTLTAEDTTVVDTGLSPATAYNYRAYRVVNGAIAEASDILKTSTMDTTSHNFNWEIIEIASPFGSAVLQDVAIINENDIWAVGQIYADSTQPSHLYNAIHWDGQQWELKRIPTNSVVGMGYYPINTVFAFDSDNVWMFSDAGSYCHWNGTSWQTQYVPERQGRINKIWGSSPTNIYFVGTNGNITHYNGSSWQKIESGTVLPIQDIWGGTDPESGEEVILCVASEKYSVSEKKILKIDPQNQQVTFFDWPFQNRRIHSVWFMNNRSTWICGAGVFKNENNIWKEFTEIPLIFTNRIRGNNINDIFVAGDFGIVAHYNGSSWRVYPEVNAPLYHSLDFRDNIMVSVGEDAPKAAILIGRRN